MPVSGLSPLSSHDETTEGFYGELYPNLDTEYHLHDNSMEWKILGKIGS